MKKNNNELEKYWQMERLKALYYELSAPIREHFKSFIRVDLKNGGHYYEVVLHDSPDHVKLTAKGHRNAKKVTVVQANGKDLILRETTAGLLYTPQSSRMFRSFEFETALCFVCDVNLARSRGKRIEDGIRPYIEGVVTAPTKTYLSTLYQELCDLMEMVDKGERSRYINRIKELRKIIENKTGRAPTIIRSDKFGQKESSKTLYASLTDEYNSDAELKQWIISNKSLLDIGDTGVHKDALDIALEGGISIETVDKQRIVHSKRVKPSE